MDPVIGRKNEIERVVQILCRRTKNNPVLIGEAGVGKTAIVEGLAQEIASGNVPEILRDKKVITLDLALMVAGTKYRGQFEERIKAVMEEIRKLKSVLLFIDELHTLVGAGSAEGAMDASNIIKPALSRGELQCIGATTMNEYRKYIEKDSALERRFQTVRVDAPPSMKRSRFCTVSVRNMRNITTPRFQMRPSPPRFASANATSQADTCPIKRSTLWTKRVLDAGLPPASARQNSNWPRVKSRPFARKKRRPSRPKTLKKPPLYGIAKKNLPQSWKMI